METARILRWQAISIPLDMIEAKIDLKYARNRNAWAAFKVAAQGSRRLTD